MRVKDYPKEIEVGDATYKVVFVTEERMQKEVGTPGKTLGLCCQAQETIYILRGLAPRERLRVFLHELLHAAEFEYGIELPHKVIYALERPLEEILLANGWVKR